MLTPNAFYPKMIVPDNIFFVLRGYYFLIFQQYKIVISARFIIPYHRAVKIKLKILQSYSSQAKSCATESSAGVCQVAAQM